MHNSLHYKPNPKMIRKWTRQEPSRITTFFHVTQICLLLSTPQPTDWHVFSTTVWILRCQLVADCKTLQMQMLESASRARGERFDAQAAAAAAISFYGFPAHQLPSLQVTLFALCHLFCCASFIAETHTHTHPFFRYRFINIQMGFGLD